MNTSFLSRTAIFFAFLSTCAGAEVAVSSDPAVATCRRNLSLIYDAIQAHRRMHKDLPNHLADLVPRFLSDPSVLICPACQRQGVTSGDVSEAEKGGLAKSRTTYVYEFKLDRVPGIISGGSARTMREWKRREMGLLGSVVPIVRCHCHGRSLNLSFGGEIYESDQDWEKLFTEFVNFDDLRPSALFRDDVTTRIILIPSRADGTPPHLVDLSEHYNASLRSGWHGGNPANTLASLPTGVQTFGGVVFDVRGVVQLAGNNSLRGLYPAAVTNIELNRLCRKLHFLQSAAYSAPRGTAVGFYRIRFADGTAAEHLIRYGADLLDWWSNPEGKLTPGDGRVAWVGTNEASRAKGGAVRLYQTIWTNPTPNAQLRSLDFISAMTNSAPFLIAVTAEP